jgi:hypothetical protein
MLIIIVAAVAVLQGVVEALAVMVAVAQAVEVQVRVVRLVRQIEAVAVAVEALTKELPHFVRKALLAVQVFL